MLASNSRSAGGGTGIGLKRRTAGQSLGVYSLQVWDTPCRFWFCVGSFIGYLVSSKHDKNILRTRFCTKHQIHHKQTIISISFFIPTHFSRPRSAAPTSARATSSEEEPNPSCLFRRFRSSNQQVGSVCMFYTLYQSPRNCKDLNLCQPPRWTAVFLPTRLLLPWHTRARRRSGFCDLPPSCHQRQKRKAHVRR